MENQPISNSSITNDTLESLTEEDLEAIDAIEAEFLQHFKKRQSPSSQNDNALSLRKTRRQLPNSIVALCSPFSPSPCQVNVKMRFPELRFGGKIVYSRTKAEVEKAAKAILKSNNAVILGFDIEWKPSFKRGVLPGKVAVMQLCSGIDHCHVMHIIHSGITESLQVLLEDSTVLKVGLGIGNDCVKVFKDYGVSVKAVEDLSYLANKKLEREPKNWSLQSLAEKLVCKELPKPNKIRLGNWEVAVLSKEQREYAATDAFASWQLYQVLKSHRM